MVKQHGCRKNFIKMKLYNDPLLIKLDPRDFTYERKVRREFCKKPSADSSRDSQRKVRPLRFGQWSYGIFNKK